MYHSPHLLSHAEHLNTIFQDTINTDDNNSLNYPSFYNFQEKYIDISSVESLTFNGNEFLIVCVNMRSIVNLLNFSKLEAFIHNLEPKPDIIAVTETWIQSNAPGPYYNLSGYLFVSNSRKSHRGGEVGVYEVCLKSIGTVCFAQTTLATVIKALFFKMAQCLVVVKM